MAMAPFTWEKLRSDVKLILAVEPATLARSLIVLMVAALMFSTAATVIIEVLIFLCIVGFADLRRRIVPALRQPMVFMALVIYFMVTIGVFYSVAPFSEGIDLWGNWRKMLLVPMVAAVYTDPLWKQRLVSVFIGLAALSALLSFPAYLLDMGNKYGPGILVQTASTQGMVFSVALFACLVLLRFPQPSVFLNKRLLALSAVVLVLSITLVSYGRSGYLALVVLAMVFVFWGVPRRIKFIVMLLVPALIASLLLISPVAQERLSQGIGEMTTYEQDSIETSMGLRVILWKNTITLLKRFERPFFGYGTAGFEAAYTSLMNEKKIVGERRWQDRPVHDPHNQYLSILVEYGLVGFVLFLLFIGSFFRQSVANPYYILGVGTLLAWCATSFFSAHFTTSMEGRFLLVWCAAMLSADMVVKDGEMKAEGGS